jgi:hypothetical protein
MDRRPRDGREERQPARSGRWDVRHELDNHPHPAAALAEAGADEMVQNLVGYDIVRLVERLKGRSER